MIDIKYYIKNNALQYKFIITVLYLNNLLVKLLNLILLFSEEKSRQDKRSITVKSSRKRTERTSLLLVHK